MITQLIIICLLLLLLISFVLVVSLKGGRSNSANSIEQRNQLNRELYDIRLHEIDEDEKQGKVLDKSAMVTELQYNLLDDINEQQRQVKNQQSWIWLPGVLLLCLASFFIYRHVGAYSEVSHWQQVLQRYPGIQKNLFENPHAQPSQSELKELMLGLRTHLSKQPQDVKGWLLYSRLGRVFKDKSAAMGGVEKAYAAKPDDTQVQLEYIELALQIGDELDQIKARKLLDRLIDQQPDNYQAWSILGFLALQQEDYQGAISSWQKMLTLVQPESEQANMLRNSIDYAKQQLAMQKQAKVEQPKTLGPSYSVKVSIAAQVPVSKGATLFVYAQAVNGPAMPIAATKLEIKQFPINVTLSDANVMMQGMKLSDHEQFIIKARISSDGSVNQSSGQWFGVSKIVNKSQTEPVNIVINQQS